MRAWHALRDGRHYTRHRAFEASRAATALGEHATWLVLFLHLVFVVAIAQLAFALSHDLTLHGFLVFCGLFVPVWWAWVCFTVYADRFDSDDVVHRVVMLCGMFAVGAMASVVPDAAVGDTAAFAITYAAIQLLVVALTVRVWLNIPKARPLMNVYLPAFTTTAGLMLVSVAVPPPGRYWIWASRSASASARRS